MVTFLTSGPRPTLVLCCLIQKEITEVASSPRTLLLQSRLPPASWTCNRKEKLDRNHFKKSFWRPKCRFARVFCPRMSSRAILGLRRFDLHIGRWGPGHIFCSGGQKTPNLTGTLLEYTCQPNRIEEVYKWEHHDDQTWCKGRSIKDLVRFQEKCRNIFPFYKLCCKFYATIYMKLGRKSFRWIFIHAKVSS